MGSPSMNDSSASADRAPVVIIGAGLAGLACARELTRAGLPCLILDAADRIGGRVTTDEVDGFLLDRGFQVFLDSYPEAQRQLDLPALALGSFTPGALIRRGDRVARVGDPWRDPIAGLQSVLGGSFTVADGLRMLGLRSDTLRGGSGDRDSGGSMLDALRERGFSDRSVERFFRPFFAGVLLDESLGTTGVWFEFLFGMFASGRATLPARGMRAIPEQLAASLPSGTIRLGARVGAIEGCDVLLTSGERIHSTAVVIATESGTAATLDARISDPGAFGCRTIYFAADSAPIAEPILMLDGSAERRGPIHHLCVPSGVCASYAPAGRTLISATSVGISALDDAEFTAAAQRQMEGWFGATVVRQWRPLAVHRIPNALPQRFPNEQARDEAVRIGEGVFACGDHLETPSINGALRSGRRAADAVRSCRL